GMQIGMRHTLEMLAANPADVLLAAAVIAPGGPDDPIDPQALAKVGVAVRISDRLNLPGGTVQATIQGVRRIRLTEVTEGDGLVARVEPAAEVPVPDDVAEPLIARILTALEALAGEVERIPGEVPRILRMNVSDPGRFADLVATLANFSVAAKDEVVQRLDVRERLEYVLGELEGQLRRVRHVEEADAAAERKEAESTATPAERAAEIRQRIKMLQAELGEIDPAEREAIELMRRLDAADLPGAVASRARAEIERLRTVQPTSTEASEIRSYVDWLFNRPWKRRAPAGPASLARAEIERLRTVQPTSTEASEIRSYVDWLFNLPWKRRATVGPASIDLAAVERAMDEALLGLEEPKAYLLDYLAVARLRGDLRGP